MLKIAPALALPFLSLAAADDGAAVLGVAAGARNGVVAGTNLGGVAIGALNDLEGLDRDLGREAAAIDFRAGKPLDGNLYGNGVKFYVKGVNWYGSEGRVDGPGPPGGLDVHSISWYMAFLAKNGFNAIRLLFNHEQVLSGARLASGEDIDWGKAPELSGKSYLEMFQIIAREAGRQGLLILFACHRLSPDAWPGDGLWYDATVSETMVMQVGRAAGTLPPPPPPPPPLTPRHTASSHHTVS